ncbi:MAG: hypothetical protein HN712_29040 [Gemmatimonadetes bacterium]|mgnify:FL=1|jgi:hypothetical protein|nr:hypothetical protein [Gemmatimonadota bacterium]MBT6147926.1 hypothetical protein [Gemmatimonadota bacterium]MBT7864390.1 hypothetical protein [Gemmatimonadota bacterium]
MELNATAKVVERGGKVIDGSALARNKGRQIGRIPEDATPTDPDRAIETARRTVINRAAARSQNRAAAQGLANRVKDGQSLGALKATSGPPAGKISTSSLLATTEKDRSRTSLFDLPSSGGALIDRMRGQVKSSSPLNSLLGGEDGPGLLSGLVGIDKSNPLGALGKSPMSLSAAQSLTNGLRSSSTRISNSSRSLMQVSNPLRSNGGFALQLPASSLNLLG